MKKIVKSILVIFIVGIAFFNFSSAITNKTIDISLNDAEAYCDTWIEINPITYEIEDEFQCCTPGICCVVSFPFIMGYDMYKVD